MFAGKNAFDTVCLTVVSAFFLPFQSGINIAKVLSAKRKLEAKRKRHEKKMARQAQRVRL